MKCELLSIREGVPTSQRTNERRYRIRDAPGISTTEPPVKASEDDERAFIPRSLTKIHKRIEHWTTRQDEFWLSIRFDVGGVDDEVFELEKYSIFVSYGQYHEALWGIVKTKPCQHEEKTPEPLSLDLDAKTFTGLQWTGVQEECRIFIALVRGNARSRWLVVHGLLGRGINYNGTREQVHQQVMLRCDSCCDLCAVRAAGALQGKWLVVL